MVQQSVENLTDLTGRVAVVVGSTSGLGRIIAIGLARAGADVVPTGRRQQLVDEVAKEIESRGRRTLAVIVDVADRKSIDALRDMVVERFGRVQHFDQCGGSDCAQANCRCY